MCVDATVRYSSGVKIMANSILFYGFYHCRFIVCSVVKLLVKSSFLHCLM